MTLVRTAVKIKEGTVVWEAEAHAEICQEEKSPIQIRKHQTSAQVDNGLPEHLTDLYNRSTPEFNDREKYSAKQLLVEYHEILSKHDLDLGCLTFVTHKIDTKDNPPVKHKMRRTPLGFQDQEKAQLEGSVLNLTVKRSMAKQVAFISNTPASLLPKVANANARGI